MEGEGKEGSPGFGRNGCAKFDEAMKWRWKRCGWGGRGLFVGFDKAGGWIVCSGGVRRCGGAAGCCVDCVCSGGMRRSGGAAGGRVVYLGFGQGEITACTPL